MNLILETFKLFIADPAAWDMYVTGGAGTGKTTDTGEVLQWCLDNNIEVMVCAFTHKACGILRTKVPAGVPVTTLHSFLKKRPTINPNATKHQHLVSSAQAGEPDKVKLIFIDEYSMIGEKDYLDLRALQDEDYDGNAEVKIVWLGDPYQLPPVGDTQAVVPEGQYKVLLTEQKRRAEDNPLGKPIAELISYIEGKAAQQPLTTSELFVRGKDIAIEFQNDPEPDKVMLCYTNRAVQINNFSIEGREDPVYGDKLFSPSTQQYYTFLRHVVRHDVDEICKPFGEPLQLNSKYRTLEHLLKLTEVEFAEVETEDGDQVVMAFLFGHYNFKQYKDTYSAAASGCALA